MKLGNHQSSPSPSSPPEAPAGKCCQFFYWWWIYHFSEAPALAFNCHLSSEGQPQLPWVPMACFSQHKTVKWSSWKGFSGAQSYAPDKWGEVVEPHRPDKNRDGLVSGRLVPRPPQHPMWAARLPLMLFLFPLETTAPENSKNLMNWNALAMGCSGQLGPSEKKEAPSPL